MASVQHIIEPGLTAFSAAEIHVVICVAPPGRAVVLVSALPGPDAIIPLTEQAVVPIGLVPEEFLHQYLSLITKHRQV